MPTGPGTTTVIYPKIDSYGAVGKPHLPVWNYLCWIGKVKTVEFFRLTCYDVTYVGRTYQFRLQCLQWGVHTVVDSFRGCLVRLLLGSLVGM